MQTIERPVPVATVGRDPGILVADERATLLTILKDELESRGFRVWLAADGDDAVELYRQHHRAIELVLLDTHLPGLDGQRTLEALRQINPDVAACFMSGTAPKGSEDSRGPGVIRVFPKPFDAGRVAASLYSVWFESVRPPALTRRVSAGSYVNPR